MDDDRLLTREEVQELLDAHNARVDASKAASLSIPPWSGCFLGLSGIVSEVSHEDIADGWMRLRRLETSISSMDVFSSAKESNRETFEAARVVDLLDHELIISQDFSAQNALHLGHFACLALSIQTGLQLSCLIAASQSFDALLASPRNSVSFYETGGFKKFYQFYNKPVHRPVKSNEVMKLLESLLILHKRGKNLRLQVACELFDTWAQSKNPRTALSSLWAGIDAIYGKNERNSRKALAIRVSEFLPRFEIEHVENAYQTRCDAVHGRHSSSERLHQGIVVAYEMLLETLRQILRERSLPLPDSHSS